MDQNRTRWKLDEQEAVLKALLEINLTEEQMPANLAQNTSLATTSFQRIKK